MLSEQDCPSEVGKRWPQPGELWSLWDLMKVFEPARLFRVMSNLEAVRSVMVVDSEVLTIKGASVTMSEARQLRDDLRELKLPVSEDSADELLAHVQRHMPQDQSDELRFEADTARQLTQIIHDLGGRVESELKRIICIALDAHQTEHYRDPLKTFFNGPLPPALYGLEYDIEEATKSLALRRNTATVYHLMKVMEDMVRKLASKAGQVVSGSIEIYKANGDFKDWGSIISAIKEGAIDEMSARKMTAEVAQWTAIHGLLYAVKEAWRNPTMHPASKYTDEEAEEVFSTVRILVRSLVKLL